MFFFESMAKPCLTRKCTVLGVISYPNFQIVVISLQHGYQNKSNNFQWLNKENFYWLNWEETFLKWKANAIYDRKKLRKKSEGRSGNFNLFNSRKPKSIKHDLSQLQGCCRRLKLQSKRTMTYIVVKSGQRHKKWKVNCREVYNINKLSLGISQVL